MKKLLSLALVAVLLLSTLTGCNVLLTLQDLLDPTEPSGNTPTEPTVRTTVTEEEFLTAMASTNFTFTAGDDTREQLIQFSDSAYYGKVTELVTNRIYDEFYLVFIDNVYYALSNTPYGYVAYPQADFSTPKLSQFMSQFIGAFTYSDLVYSEASKSYKYSVEDESGYTEFFFENGMIKTIHMELQDGKVDACNIGTTVVEVPEYTIYEDFPIRTTVTEEEFLAAMESNNFSVSGTSAFDNTFTSSEKTNGSVTYQYECTSNADGSISEKDFYYATIDNVQYQIVKEDSGYVAYKYDGFHIVHAPKLGNTFSRPFSYYEYDESSMSYVYSAENYIFRLYFADGVIQSATCIGTYSNIYYKYFDFGTTVVELPEFTYAPTDSQ